MSAAESTRTVPPGSETGIYYIPFSGVHFRTSLKEIKKFIREACPYEHVEYFPKSTCGWVRVNGQDNFAKAIERFRNGVLNGRALVAMADNESKAIIIRDTEVSGRSRVPKEEWNTADTGTSADIGQQGLAGGEAPGYYETQAPYNYGPAYQGRVYAYDEPAAEAEGSGAAAEQQQPNYDPRAFAGQGVDSRQWLEAQAYAQQAYDHVDTEKSTRQVTLTNIPQSVEEPAVKATVYKAAAPYPGGIEKVNVRREEARKMKRATVTCSSREVAKAMAKALHGKKLKGVPMGARLRIPADEDQPSTTSPFHPQYKPDDGAAGGGRGKGKEKVVVVDGSSR